MSRRRPPRPHGAPANRDRGRQSVRRPGALQELPILTIEKLSTRAARAGVEPVDTIAHVLQRAAVEGA